VAKKAKTSKKKKASRKMTPGALKKLGAARFAAAAAGGAGPVNSPTHQKGSFIVAPGVGGTTIVCFFNPNTGNFDDCHTVQGTIGVISA
jgi:hypothetical protein